jgi:hypothetical protein
MKNNQNKNEKNISWLNEDLLQKVRSHFEPKYKRRLSNREVADIAENLTGYMETIIKFKLRYENKQNIT